LIKLKLLHLRAFKVELSNSAEEFQKLHVLKFFVALHSF